MIYFIPLYFLFYMISFSRSYNFHIYIPSRVKRGKGKGLPQQAEVAQGVASRLRSRILLTFGTTRVVGRQPYAPAAFSPGEIPATHF